jgi:hypothetical protein
MKFFSYPARLAPALIVACVLSACGGGSDSSGFFGLPVAGTSSTPPVTPPDTGIKPEMRCAP